MNTEEIKDIVEPTTPESFEIEKSPTADNEKEVIKTEVIPSTEATIVQDVPTTHYLSLTQVCYCRGIYS